MAITKRLSALLLAFFLLASPAHAVQFGAGTGTGYPAAVDTVYTRTNKGGGACSSATGSNICAEFTNDLQGAVTAIEAELGLAPKGTFASVLARLNASVYSGTAGLSSYVAGDLLQASNTTTLARLANVATGNVLLSGGVGVVSAWGKVGLTTHVDGILPTANGGTGIAYFTAAGPTTARVYTFPDSAATMLYSGGALGTPSSGTLTNVTGLPAASVLAGTLGTGAYVMDTTLTLPKLIGGTGTTSTLTLQSTSGVGATGADIIFKVGNNGATEAGRFKNDGSTELSGALTATNFDLGGGLKFVGNTSLMYFRRSSDSVNLAKIDLSSGDFIAYYGFSSPFSFRLSGDNGQQYVQGRATQLVAVGSGLSTKATTIQIPADAIVDVVSVRVKTQPGGTSTVVVTSTTSGDQFQKGASISTVAGTTDPGTKGSPRNYNGVAAQTVTLTFDTSTTDALGEIRVDLVYRTMTPATS